MRITDVYVGYLKITRIIQIGSILVKHGFKEMISHTFWGVVSESAVSANINQYIPPRNGCG